MSKSETTVSVQCRCGARIASGGTVFEVTTLPASLEGVFRGTIFCSPRCLRAFCLESLELLDLLDTEEAKVTVTDLHELNMEVAMTLVAVLGEEAQPGVKGAHLRRPGA
jgi:hypothetical protein